MTCRDKLLALRAKKGVDQEVSKVSKGAFDTFDTSPPTAIFNEGAVLGDTTPNGTASPQFPERHCAECGKEGEASSPLIESEGYLRHRACSRPATCWHGGKAAYRPMRLAWGKDLIPLHDRCAGAWIDAWDAVLSR